MHHRKEYQTPDDVPGHHFLDNGTPSLSPVLRPIQAHAMESAHRKIELQSHEDLAFLLNNVRRAARDQLDNAFPQIEGSNAGEDELRVPIERLVNEVRLPFVYI